LIEKDIEKTLVLVSSEDESMSDLSDEDIDQVEQELLREIEEEGFEEASIISLITPNKVDNTEDEDQEEATTNDIRKALSNQDTYGGLSDESEEVDDESG